MATGSSHQLYQTPVSCEICEGTEDVDSYCLMCKGPMCGTCVVTHTRTPMFRKHKIVQLVEGLQQQSAEEEYEECNEHATYICPMHCNVCHKLVCSKCISSGIHWGHEFCEIEAALQRVKQEILEYQNTLETRYLLQYRKQEENITQEMAECKEAAMSVKSDINNKHTELITEIHKVCDDMLSKVDDEEKQQSLQLDKSLHKVQELIKEIEVLMTQSKDALTKLASEVIKFNRDKPSLSHLDVQEAPEICPSTFVPGTINREKMTEQIGKLVSHKHPQIDISIILRAKFVRGIGSINTVYGYQAWVTALYSKDLSLVDTECREVNHINTESEIFDLAVTSVGDIIVTNHDGGCIRILTETGQVKNTIKTKPNRATGVCLGKNGQDVAVCVYRPDNKSSKLVVYDQDGKEMRVISYTDKPVGKYTSQRVTQNNRGDYCVAHWGHNKVYVLDTVGGQRWTYDGSGAGQLEKEFVPWDISSDIYNNN